MATISIADNDARIQHSIGGGGNTANSTQFTIDFPFFSLDDINVIITDSSGADTTLTRGTGSNTFAVTGTSVDDGFSGGNITLGSVYTSSTVTIFRDLEVARTSDFATSGPFNISSLNTDLDKIYATLQQLQTKSNRSLTMADSDDANEIQLPNKFDRKGNVLAFNATSGAAEPGPSIGSVTTVASQSANINTVAGISANVNTVAGISSNVSTVAGISGNVSSVAGNASNINSAVSNATNINTVAGSISNVNTVAGINSAVSTVASNNANVSTVATNISSVNTVAADITKVVAVANDLAEVVSEIETVADDLNETTSEIDVVANNIANVNTVGGISANVTTVAGISANVTTVAGIQANVTTVAGNSSNVSTVAGISSDVTTVAGANSNITALNASGVITNIGTVATNVSNVNSVGSNISNVNSVASNSSNINSVAGALTNISTVASNVTSINNFDARYRVASSDPTTSLDVGDLYFNTSDNELRTYNGSAWQTTAVSPALQNNINIVSGEITSTEDLGSITNSIDTSSGNNIDTVANAITEINSVASVSSSIPTVANNISTINSVATTIAGTQTFAVTVAGGKFVIDGDNNPTLSLVRGFTYTFDVSNSSVANHPLAFKNGSSSYTTGVTSTGTAGQAGAKVTFAVPTDAPATGLLYYCTVHGNSMGNTITTTQNDIAVVVQNIGEVNGFASRYRIASSAPTSSLDEGDLYYNTTTNSLNYYNGSAFVAVVAGAMTSLEIDTTPQLGGNLDLNGNSIVSVSNGDITIAPNGSGEINLNGTVNTDNLILDFGSIA